MRNLFNVWQFYESAGLSDSVAECFVAYLAGHNRPPHAVLFGDTYFLNTLAICSRLLCRPPFSAGS